ncbi:MAG: porin family protein [Bacteroidota bacterium]|nr:porin family protein [Bacteroidota bacterium]
MRHIIIAFCTLLLFSFPGKGYSQRGILNMVTYDHDLLHFGFVLGINQTLLTVRPIADLNTHVFDSTYCPDILPLPDSARILGIESVGRPGFVISIVSNLRIGDNLALRFIPSLSFGDRDLVYSIVTYRNGESTLRSITKKIPSTYVNFPLELTYRAERYYNFRPYLISGAQYTLDLASQAKKREKKSGNDKIVKLNANDVYLEAGVGFDFYNEWFKFGIELKMMYGLLDILKHENNIYTEGISNLNSKIFQVSLTFE